MAITGTFNLKYQFTEKLAWKGRNVDGETGRK